MPSACTEEKAEAPGRNWVPSAPPQQPIRSWSTRGFASAVLSSLLRPPLPRSASPGSALWYFLLLSDS